MNRFLIAVAAAVALASQVHAGGPPPMYVVVDEVTIATSGGVERVTIRGSFIRVKDRPEHEYGKPLKGFVCLSLDEKKAAECRAEWKKWAKATGTGKAVAVGICSEGGAMLTVKIHEPGDKSTGPDAIYTPGHLDNFDPPGKGWSDQPAVKTLLAFVKEQKVAGR